MLQSSRSLTLYASGWTDAEEGFGPAMLKKLTAFISRPVVALVAFTVVAATLPGTESSESPEALEGEKLRMRQWMEKEGLNKYGDPAGTMYAGGDPLFDESTAGTRRT